MVVLLIAGMGAASCSDDGDSKTITLDEYFQQIDQLQNANDAAFATQESGTEEPAADATGEEISAYLKANITESAEIFRDTVAGLEDIDPPDEAADAHAAITASLNAAADALDSTAADIPDSMTMEELEASGEEIFGGEELSAAFQGISDACNVLTQIAADNSIDVDLACEEEG
jgi:hypothetical protein